jgi:hypothetical protein
MVTISGPDGTDTLFGIDRLEFADGSNVAATPEGWVL